MRAVRNFLALLVAGLGPPVSGGALGVEPQPLGEWTGFYRMMPVLDRTLAEGRLLVRIPDWMTQTDFPYEKKPVAQEAPFADSLTVVRLLGGWSDPGLPSDRRSDENDLVWRDEGGLLHYRWNLLKERLDPYVEGGYGLTLVLDNVPWSLAAEPANGTYGQIAPPADFDEWETFVREMCRELKRLYGEERANGFRFRLGTEMQDHRRFLGDQEAYLKYYDHAAVAIRSELPGAKVGPFNRSNPVGKRGADDASAETVDIEEVAGHALGGTGGGDSDVGVPFDFLARSFYYFSSEPQPGQFRNVHPDERVPQLRELWDRVSSLDARFASLPREVHEFGPHLKTEGGIYGLDTGARGAAQTLHTLVALREAGAERVSHWQIFERVKDDQQLLMSQGWLYSVLDAMRGGMAYVLPVAAKNASDNTQKALLSVGADRAVLVVANWNVDRTKDSADTLEVHIPQNILPWQPATMRSTVLDGHSSVYDVIRADLREAGLLSPKHKAHAGAPATTLAKPGYDSMAADAEEGRGFVARNWPKYLALMTNSLTLKPFEGHGSPAGGGWSLEFPAACPSVTVIVLDRAAPPTSASSRP